MAPRFDAQRRRLELAVADLLDRSVLGRIGFSNRGGYERLWLGQALHSTLQKRRLAEDASYQPEVAVRLELRHREWNVGISGRIDGLRQEATGTLVLEELKSVRRQGYLAPEVRELYEAQARLYAWMLSRLRAQPVRAELVLVAIADGSIERSQVDWRSERVEVAVRARLDALLEEFEAQTSEREHRRVAAARLRFPHPRFRSGQEEIVAAVELALSQGEHLLVQAPTGIGKTDAALFPAVRHILAENRRLFVLTAKTLQQKMSVAVLRALAPGTGLHGVQLRAKAKMCAHTELLCHEDYCPFARNYWGKLIESHVLQKLWNTETVLDPDRIFEAARAAEVCPFEVSLDLSERAQVVVGDYNYAFEPYVRLSDFGPEEELSNTILLVDEVHNLVDRGRSYLSPELDSLLVDRLEHHARTLPAELGDRILELAADLLGKLNSTVSEALEGKLKRHNTALADFEENFFQSLRSRLDPIFVAYLEFQRETGSFRSEDPLVEFYFRYLRFLGGFTTRDACVDRLAELREGRPVVRFFCKNPSSWLASILSRVHAFVGLSATLSPMEFYRDLLGLDSHRFVALKVDPAFPRENLRVVVDSGVFTEYKHRFENLPQLVSRLQEFLAEVPGNCLVLFPSFEYLDLVRGQLELPGKVLLFQTATDTPEDRERMLEHLKSPLAAPAVLLGVAGGVFSEGVDYPGDMVQAVAIVSPCLPVPSLEVDLLERYFQEHFEKGFEYAYVVPGMTRVVQAAGRLIRSETDRGVIALFCRRFLRRPYVDHLPAPWLPAEGAAGLSGVPAQVAREFFGLRSSGAPRAPLLTPTSTSAGA